MNNNFTLMIGYSSSSIVSFIHYQDIILAFVVGFAGALGAWVFKKLVDRT
jgi:capsular polysaccharide biosynthesis protein